MLRHRVFTLKVYVLGFGSYATLGGEVDQHRVYVMGCLRSRALLYGG